MSLLKTPFRTTLNMLIQPGSSSARFALNFTKWNPSAAEWSDCCSRIEPEEITRIHRFVFRKDAKAALAGRLLLRNFLTEALGVKNSSLVFGRTDKGKPFLQEPTQTSWNFNLSHSGDFVLFGAEQDALIGIDVMKTEFPKRKNLADYFTLMQSQFSSREWSVIKAPTKDVDKLRNFYRLWCLKESYVKALGVGIGYNVSRLDFDVPVEPRPFANDSPKVPVEPRPASSDSPTISLLVDGEEQKNWNFSEFFVDDEHIGAAAIQAPPEIMKQKISPEIFFVKIDELVSRLEPIGEVNVDLGLKFISKPDKPS